MQTNRVGERTGGAKKRDEGRAGRCEGEGAGGQGQGDEGPLRLGGEEAGAGRGCFYFRICFYFLSKEGPGRGCVFPAASFV